MPYWRKNALFRSADNGQNWESLPPHPGEDPEDVFIGLDGSLYVLVDSDIYRSEDNGESWTNIGGPGETLFRIFALPSGVLIAVGFDDVYRSEDAAATWENVDLNAFSLLISAFHYDAFTGDLYFFRRNGNEAYRTSDDGLTWTTITNSEVNNVTDLTVGPQGTIWTIEDEKLWFSTDGGVSWQERSGFYRYSNPKHTANRSHRRRAIMGRTRRVYCFF